MGRETGLLQLLAPLLLTGGKGVDLVIRGDVSTRYQHALPRRCCEADLHRLSIKPAGPRPSRTVLRDRLRFRSLNQETWYEIYRLDMKLYMSLLSITSPPCTSTCMHPH
jgi:hypothetical protein